MTLPCKNPACNSYGQSHANCKCYQNMADGGPTGSFCSSTNMHDPKCKYFIDAIDQIAKNMQGDNPEHTVNGFVAHQGMAGILGLTQAQDLTKYNKASENGHRNMGKHIDALFSGEKVDDPKNLDQRKEKIKDWIKKGGVENSLQQEIYRQNSPVQMAEGGDVSQDPTEGLYNPVLSELHPTQNLMLQSTKGLVSNYLKNLMPQSNQPKLAFDDEPDTTQATKTYGQAVDIANNPLSVLKKINDGTIEPSDVKHLNAMYPELNTSLQQKVTQRITQAQLQGEKPNYAVRQGLSMFMGTPLSGELTPRNIQAAQAVFQNQQQQQQNQSPAKPVTKDKKNTSKLSKSDQSFLTGNQALVARSQKQ